MAKFELGVIGGGNMAEALIKGIVAAGVRKPSQIIVSDPAAARRDVIAKLGAAATEDNLRPAACPLVVLAVKPQVMDQVLAQIAPAVAEDAAVVSIAAGVPTSRIDGKLGGRGHIIRVMPNTPMLVGAGISAIAAGPRTRPDDLKQVEQLFAASGQTILVDEALMDAVTALSGSGPAYFFYLIEAMIEAGVAEGLDADAARRLAAQTCAGAAKLLIESGETPEDLRTKVTSPGGTTQRAIETMEAAGVKDALVRAVRAAAARSKELGS